MTTLVRGRVLHTPRPGTLEAFDDGAVAFDDDDDDDGRILATGPYATVRAAHPHATVSALPGAIVLPGLVDTHVHFPQVSIIGSMGLRLLEWLQTRTLPEEARLADEAVARATARRFLARLLANGTTTALVFGSHFPRAQVVFFEEALASGLRITSGLVVSDRELLPALHATPAAAHAASAALMAAWHGRGRLRYAVTPRFSLSCTEEMLEGCRAVLGREDGAFLTSHLNENPDEIRAVAARFPWARDYLDTYDRFGLVGERSVFAHDVHPTEPELERLAATRAVVAHCPSSNAFLGSGLFPLRRHREHGVRIALGTDVGAGTAFSLFNEGLQAYLGQMLRTDGERLGPADLLWLATRAGAEALGLGDEVGDLAPGRSADLVVVQPPAGSTLEAVLADSPSAEAALGAVFTLARETSVAEVRVAGRVVAAPERGMPPGAGV